MAVNGVEIQVGQTWRTLAGLSVTIVWRDDSSTYCWNTACGRSFTDDGREYVIVDSDRLSQLIAGPGFVECGNTCPEIVARPDQMPGEIIGFAAPVNMTVPGYESLADVLQRAYDQASIGKGKERHANGKAFDVQPMQDLIRLHGVGFATGQSSKKASEALGLPTVERQVAELLGAINYLAGAVIALEIAHNANGGAA